MVANTRALRADVGRVKSHPHVIAHLAGPSASLLSSDLTKPLRGCPKIRCERLVIFVITQRTSFRALGCSFAPYAKSSHSP